MASNGGIATFLTDCERLLKCELAGLSQSAEALAKPTRLTRYLFPMSLHAVGIHPPNEVVELVLVANITPRTFWSEVEETFAETDYKFAIMKSKIHPTSSMLDLQPATSSTMRIEFQGQVILLEYCQSAEAFEAIVDNNGRIFSGLETDQGLLDRARYIQQLHWCENKDGEVLELYRDRVNLCLQWAHHSGILSQRLNFLTPQQVFSTFTLSQVLCGMDEAPDTTVLLRMWEQFSKNPLHESSIHPIPDKAINQPPDSLAKGLEMFHQAHSLFISIQVNCWKSFQRPLFMDAFFDVIAVLQASVKDKGKYGARAWPFYLTDRTDENGAAYFLIGVYRADNIYEDIDEREHNDFFEASCTTDKVYEIAIEQMGRQFSVQKDDECYIQSSLTGRENNIFKNATDHLQRHVAPIRGLTADSLPKLEGEQLVRDFQDLDDNNEPRMKGVAVDDGQSIPFRTEKKVLDQLRWDPKYAGSRSYEVGYVDRFSDALLWLPIEDWVQTTEEEEFIPLHRIRQYRHIKTKDVVWDRALRLDKLK